MAPDEPNPSPDVAPESTNKARPPAIAWQPFTPRGVAAFAGATPSRLFVVELIVALGSTLVVLWFLLTGWFPVVADAIQSLPDTGAIRSRQLSSPYNSIEPLGLNHYLAFVVDVEQRTASTVASDVVVEFHRRDFQVCSLLGCVFFTYPRGWEVEFNRPGLITWWEAWRPHLVWMTAVGVVMFLLAVWAILAAFYAPSVKLGVFFKDRHATLAGCWRMAGAALMPGALVLNGSLVLYGLGIFGLVEFLVLAALHFLVAWVYLFLGLKHLPPRPGVQLPSRNPFSDQPVEPEPGAAPAEPEPVKVPRNVNPFGPTPRSGSAPRDQR